MPRLGMLENLIHMDLENHLPILVKTKADKCQDSRLTSEKVRHLITKFPPSKPITTKLSSLGYHNVNTCRKCLAHGWLSDPHPIPLLPSNLETDTISGYTGSNSIRIQPITHNDEKSLAWRAVTEVIQVLQLMVTATGFALYYIIYGWVMMIYHGLRVAMFFKDSDGPMKITIGIVTATSIVVGFNMLLRIRKIYFDILR